MGFEPHDFALPQHEELGQSGTNFSSAAFAAPRVAKKCDHELAMADELLDFKVGTLEKRDSVLTGLPYTLVSPIAAATRTGHEVDLPLDIRVYVLKRGGEIAPDEGLITSAGTKDILIRHLHLRTGPCRK